MMFEIEERKGVDTVKAKDPTIIQVTGTQSSVPVNREVMNRLMKKGEAYSQIKQYLDQRGPDGRILQEIREVIRITEMMMEE